MFFTLGVWSMGFQVSAALIAVIIRITHRGDLYHNIRRPWSSLIITTMMTITIRMWIRLPPIPPRNPNSQRIMRITIMAINRSISDCHSTQYSWIVHISYVFISLVGKIYWRTELVRTQRKGESQRIHRACNFPTGRRFCDGGWFDVISIDQLPVPVQYLGKAFPLYYAADALRKVVILNASVNIIMPDLLVLLAYSVITMKRCTHL